MTWTASPWPALGWERTRFLVFVFDMLVWLCIWFYPLVLTGTSTYGFLDLRVLLPTDGRGGFAFRLFLSYCRRVGLCGSDGLGLLRLWRLRRDLSRLLRFFWPFRWTWLWSFGLLDGGFSKQHGLHSSDRLFGESGVDHPNARSPNTSLLEPPWGLPGPLGKAGPEIISASLLTLSLPISPGPLPMRS